jgi:hypothetical protein
LQAIFDAAFTRDFQLISRHSQRSRSFGWVGDAPVWLVHEHVFNAPHELVAHCELEAGAAVRRWLDELRRAQ